MMKEDGLGAEVNYPFSRIEIGPGGTGRTECFMHDDVLVERLVFPRATPACLKVLGDITLGIQILASDVDYERLASLEGPSVVPQFTAMCGRKVQVVIENRTLGEVVLDGAFARVRPILGRRVMESSLVGLRDRGRALLARPDTEVFARGWLAALDELEGLTANPRKLP